MSLLDTYRARERERQRLINQLTQHWRETLTPENYQANRAGVDKLNLYELHRCIEREGLLNG